MSPEETARKCLEPIRKDAYGDCCDVCAAMDSVCESVCPTREVEARIVSALREAEAKALYWQAEADEWKAQRDLWMERAELAREAEERGPGPATDIAEVWTKLLGLMGHTPEMKQSKQLFAVLQDWALRLETAVMKEAREAQRWEDAGRICHMCAQHGPPRDGHHGGADVYGVVALSLPCAAARIWDEGEK